jgi:DNA-binding transcriptional LysR family regulator
MNDLPIDLLRSFVATVDRGSMAQAAPSVQRTPSAVSLQMSKLSELVGQPLFQRHGRSQVLTHAGETLLGCAREILAASERAFPCCISVPRPVVRPVKNSPDIDEASSTMGHWTVA